MLNLVSIADFAPLAGQPCELLLPDGSALPVELLSARESPQTRMNTAPPEKRTPFSVVFRSLQPSAVGCGTFAIMLAGGARLDGIYAERITGSDPALAYYQMVFN